MSIDRYLGSIQEECDYILTKDQLEMIRLYMAQYAISALMDSKVAKEAESICMEEAE